MKDIWHNIKIMILIKTAVLERQLLCIKKGAFKLLDMFQVYLYLHQILGIGTNFKSNDKWDVSESCLQIVLHIVFPLERV